MEKDGYLLELCRHVALNPVRARMVNDVDDWLWSSYPATIGRTACPSWLQPDWLLAQFASERDKVRLGYMGFVRAGIGLPSIWDGLRGQIYLGGETFIQRVQANLLPMQSLNEVPRLQRRPLAEPLMDYRIKYPDEPRKGMALAYFRHSAPL